MKDGLLNSTAIHEAGHALLAWHSPSVVEVKEVVVQGNNRGQVSCRWKNFDDPQVIWDMATILLAGTAAETLIFGEANYCTATLDLLGAKKSAEELLLTDWPGLDDWPRHFMRRTAQHNHPDFLPLEKRLNSPPGTAGIMHAAYRRSFQFLARHKFKMLVLATAIQYGQTIGKHALFIILGPRKLLTI